MSQNRQPAGVPVGGQYAASPRDEPEVRLDDLEQATQPTTHQSTAPLVHRSLHASNRMAREIANFAMQGDLDLSPPYQRPSVWGSDQRLNLVRSWMSGVPIPAVMINTRHSGAWERTNGRLAPNEPGYAAVDGKQRIETAVAWFSGDLAVPASWFPEDGVVSTRETADGPYVTYNDLTLPTQRHFANRAMLPVIEADAATIEEEADLYLLVNGAGSVQTDADMANAARVAAGQTRT